MDPYPDHGAPDAHRAGDSTPHIPIGARSFAAPAYRKDTVSTMTTNATPTPPSALTAPDTTSAATPPTPPATGGEWLTGDHYDNTAELPMSRIAEAVHMDLYDVRNDDMLPAVAEFDVSVGTDGPVPVLRIGIAGVIGESAGIGDMLNVRDVMRSAFELANHYNRVNLACPVEARFIQHINALKPNGDPAVVLIGMMHNVAIG